MPITRFEKFLRLRGQYDPYMELLEDNFNPATLNGVMCRSLFSVDWQGSVYDCDFNQVLDLPLTDREGKPLKIWDLQQGEADARPIVVGDHCYGCTAGAGSSCGGALLS